MDQIITLDLTEDNRDVEVGMSNSLVTSGIRRFGGIDPSFLFSFLSKISTQFREVQKVEGI